ncbi:ATP-binding protein [Saccharothrix sp. MB29]|nr:ATP-binding protein [Saccharothrix sp. MB29]
MSTASPGQQEAAEPQDEQPAPPETDAPAGQVQINMIRPTIDKALIGLHNVTGREDAHLTRATGLVDDQDVSVALARFVEPAGFGSTAERLARDGLLVLCGPSGTGKRSSALALLREVTDRTLYMLSPNSSPADLADYEYEPGCGYLVVDRVVDKGRPGSDFEWRLVRTG